MGDYSVDLPGGIDAIRAEHEALGRDLRIAELSAEIIRLGGEIESRKALLEAARAELARMSGEGA